MSTDRPAPDASGEQSAVPDDRPDERTAAAARRRRTGDPVLPRSPDESDVGWGEQDGDDDERLRREVPPHWS